MGTADVVVAAVSAVALAMLAVAVILTVRHRTLEFNRLWATRLTVTAACSALLLGSVLRTSIVAALGTEQAALASVVCQCSQLLSFGIGAPVYSFALLFAFRHKTNWKQGNKPLNETVVGYALAASAPFALVHTAVIVLLQAGVAPIAGQPLIEPYAAATGSCSTSMLSLAMLAVLALVFLPYFCVLLFRYQPTLLNIHLERRLRLIQAGFLLYYPAILLAAPLGFAVPSRAAAMAMVELGATLLLVIIGAWSFVIAPIWEAVAIPLRQLPPELTSGKGRVSDWATARGTIRDQPDWMRYSVRASIRSSRTLDWSGASDDSDALTRRQSRRDLRSGILHPANASTTRLTGGLRPSGSTPDLTSIGSSAAGDVPSRGLQRTAATASALQRDGSRGMFPSPMGSRSPSAASFRAKQTRSVNDLTASGLSLSGVTITGLESPGALTREQRVRSGVFSSAEYLANSPTSSPGMHRSPTLDRYRFGPSTTSGAPT